MRQASAALIAVNITTSVSKQLLPTGIWHHAVWYILVVNNIPVEPPFSDFRIG
jgi:hypothetical protein